MIPADLTGRLRSLAGFFLGLAERGRESYDGLEGNPERGRLLPAIRENASTAAALFGAAATVFDEDCDDAEDDDAAYEREHAARYDRATDAFYGLPAGTAKRDRLKLEAKRRGKASTGVSVAIVMAAVLLAPALAAAQEPAAEPVMGYRAVEALCEAQAKVLELLPEAKEASHFVVNRRMNDGRRDGGKSELEVVIEALRFGQANMAAPLLVLEDSAKNALAYCELILDEAFPEVERAPPE